MAYLDEAEVWEEGIYQWETTDPLIGGPNGIDNVPTKQLANRTAWLKKLFTDLFNGEVSALKADTLTTARKINGVNFDGSSDITITAEPTEHTHNEIVPAGTVCYFAQSTPPGGWIKANGALVSRTAYAALFAAIGTTFGAGDGSTTFKLPDLRGEFLRGWDDGRGVDSGRAFGSSQSGDIQSHSHNLGLYGNVPAVTSVAASSGSSLGAWATTTSSGGSETRPRNIAMLACIKY
ncbi:MAG: phage tail protein [Campylobacterota bacterium]